MRPYRQAAWPAGLVVGVGALFGLQVVGGWLLVFVILSGLALVLVGYAFARNELATDRLALRSSREALDAEWEALDQTRRVRGIFLNARRAMQEEARRQWPGGRGQ